MCEGLGVWGPGYMGCVRARVCGELSVCGAGCVGTWVCDGQGVWGSQDTGPSVRTQVCFPFAIQHVTTARG